MLSNKKTEGSKVPVVAYGNPGRDAKPSVSRRDRLELFLKGAKKKHRPNKEWIDLDELFYNR